MRFLFCGARRRVAGLARPHRHVLVDRDKDDQEHRPERVPGAAQVEERNDGRGGAEQDNAVAHRDYSLSAQILLYLFDDRLEVRSPGVLPNSVTLANIRTHYSHPRNEIIARVLLNLRYVNTLGSGVPRMITLLRDHAGREPDFELSVSQFMVRFWAPSTV